MKKMKYPIYDRKLYTTISSDFKYIGPKKEELENIYIPSLNYWQDAWRRFKKNKLAMFFSIILIFIFVISIISPLLTKYNYYEQNIYLASLNPIKGFKYGYILGTDTLGRDLFSRITQGVKTSMTLAIIVSSICVVIGSIYGAIAAYFHGIIDMLMVRLIEIIISIPSMIYIILLMVLLGNNIQTIIIALTLTRWLDYALLVRGEVLKIKKNEYVIVSNSLGANFWWIMIKHLIPNILGIIIIRLTMDIPSIIFSEAFLSFIGLGVPLPYASLGNLVSDGFKELNSHVYLFVIPAVIISLITLSFNVIGDNLSDSLNPKLRD